jgi:hypothetical protein
MRGTNYITGSSLFFGILSWRPLNSVLGLLIIVWLYLEWASDPIGELLFYLTNLLSTGIDLLSSPRGGSSYLNVLPVIGLNKSPGSSRLNGGFVTGFCDGESCFTVNLNNNPSLRTGLNVRLVFSIHLNIRDLELLEHIKAFFGVGNIQINKDGSITYSVTSIKDLTYVIIPHFCKYPLLTQKQADFELFRRLVELMNRKEHLTLEGLHKILSIRASMNNGLPERLKAAFPDPKYIKIYILIYPFFLLF